MNKKMEIALKVASTICAVARQNERCRNISASATEGGHVVIRNWGTNRSTMIYDDEIRLNKGIPQMTDLIKDRLRRVNQMYDWMYDAWPTGEATA